MPARAVTTLGTGHPPGSGPATELRAWDRVPDQVARVESSVHGPHPLYFLCGVRRPIQEPSPTVTAKEGDNSNTISDSVPSNFLFLSVQPQTWPLTQQTLDICEMNEFCRGHEAG